MCLIALADSSGSTLARIYRQKRLKSCSVKDNGVFSVGCQDTDQRICKPFLCWYGIKPIQPSAGHRCLPGASSHQHSAITFHFPCDLLPAVTCCGPLDSQREALNLPQQSAGMASLLRNVACGNIPPVSHNITLDLACCFDGIGVVVVLSQATFGWCVLPFASKQTG